MIKIIPIILITALLSACPDGRFIKIDEPNTCGTNGWTLTGIHYGDSRIVVIPISEVVEDGEFRFVLLPADEKTDTIDYKNVTVKVVGKPPADTWFTEKSGTASSGDGTIRVCIDASQVNPGDEFSYEVIVDTVGILDPRAFVIVRPPQRN
jgi:hypothetical protein